MPTHLTYSQGRICLKLNVVVFAKLEEIPLIKLGVKLHLQGVVQPISMCQELCPSPWQEHLDCHLQHCGVDRGMIQQLLQMADLVV